MATNNITIVANTVKALPGYSSRRFDAGGTIYAGEACYIVSDGDIERSDADGSLSAVVFGIVIAGTPDTGGTVYTDADALDAGLH